MSSNLINKHLISLSITILLYVFTYFKFGLYYGWVDDVLISNHFREILINSPIKTLASLFLGWANLLSFLYKKAPHIPWYGILLYVFSFIATFNTILLLVLLFFKKKNRILFTIAIIAGFLFLWVDNIFLVTLTRISLIVTLSSIFLLGISPLYYKNKRVLIFITFYCCLLFIGGSLIRPITLVGIIPLIISFYIILNRAKLQMPKRNIIAFGISILLVFTINVNNRNKVKKNVNKEIGHFLNITDARNTYQPTEFLYNNDINYKALFLYYIPEDKFLDKNFLDQYGPSTWYQNLNFKRYYTNLKYETSRINAFTSSYHQYLNWFNKFIILIVTNLVIMAFSKMYRIQLLLFIALIIFLFLIMLVYKTEERLILPIITFQTILNLICLNFWKKENLYYPKTAKPILFIILLSLGFYGFMRADKLAEEKKIELKGKQLFIDELNNNFKNKILFFDLWSMTLVHQSLLENINLSPNNIYTCHREYWSFFFPQHTAQLEKICKNIDFISFYKCAFEKNEEIIFVFNKQLRIDLIEEFALKNHHIKLKFEELLPNNKLKDIRYSFLPYQYEFGYYKLAAFENVEI